MEKRPLKSFLARLLVLVLSSFLLGCPTRQEINTHIWQESGLPKAVCALSPDVAKSGIYRRLNDDQCSPQHPVPCYEFISYCNPIAAKYLAISGQEYNDLLDAYLPKAKP